MRKILITILMLCTFVLTGCGGGGTTSGNTAPNENTATVETYVDENELKKNEPDEDEKNNVEETVTAAATTAKPAKKVKGDLKVTMLNVGQGDAFLIQTKTQNILIDTSDIDERSKLVSELDKAGVTTLDKIILTHPHADHIGGIEKLLKDNKYTVKEVYDNGIASANKLYIDYMKELKAQKIKHVSLTAGDTVDFGNGATFEVLYPTKDLVKAVNDGKQKTDPNNESVVGRLVYKKFSIMFTGDAEKPVESSVWADNDAKKLKSTILKAGHHGSYTASTETFVQSVKPEYVLISAGEPTEKRGGNTYGHPHLEPLEIYLANGIPAENILWTWKNGTVTILSDGKNFSVETETKGDWVKQWIADKKKSSKK